MYWLPIALLLLAALQGTAETRSIAIGGASGSSWQDGGGQIPAIFPTGARDVEGGNTPGGVIDFDPEGREGWIFPQNVVEGTNLASEYSGAAARSFRRRFSKRALSRS